MSLMLRSPDRGGWTGRFQPYRNGGLIRHTDGTKTNAGTGARVHRCGTRNLSFSLGQYTIVFQAKAYAIKVHAFENI
jgi:hypothetical protein